MMQILLWVFIQGPVKGFYVNYSPNWNAFEREKVPLKIMLGQQAKTKMNSSKSRQMVILALCHLTQRSLLKYFIQLCFSFPASANSQQPLHHSLLLQFRCLSPCSSFYPLSLSPEPCCPSSLWEVGVSSPLPPPLRPSDLYQASLESLEDTVTARTHSSLAS